MVVGLYPMVADILHVGHVAAIEEAKKNCDHLIVALYCCPTRKNPIQTIFERYMQLRAIKWIDEIIPYCDESDMENLLMSIKYDVYFLGEDYLNKDWECKNIVESCNKKIHYLHRRHKFSSTDIKNRLLGGTNNV